MQLFSKPNPTRINHKGKMAPFDYIKIKNLFYNKRHNMQSDKTSHHLRDDICYSYNQYTITRIKNKR